MTDFEQLLIALAALDGCARTKRKVRDLLFRFAGQRLHVSSRAVQRQERAALVRQLADGQRSHEELVDLLAQRWRVSASTSRRWVSRVCDE